MTSITERSLRDRMTKAETAEEIAEICRLEAMANGGPFFGGGCRTLNCFFGSQFDPGNDEWVAIKVYRDGNVIELARFLTEDEAEQCAEDERFSELRDNSQFGVGA